MNYKKWIIVSVFPFCLSATTLTVNVPGDSNISMGGTFAGSSGDLRGVLNHINLNSGSSYTINFATPVGSTITLGAMLPLLNFPFTTNNALTIDGKIDGVGPSITIDGNNAWRGFFVANGTGPGAALTQITIQNMVIQNVTSVGGSGGGGGMGAGAGLFVDSAAVTLSNVVINNATVVGGAGGTLLNAGGGGLGIGSTGSNSVGAESGGGGLGGIGFSSQMTPTSGNLGGGGGGGINCGTGFTGRGADINSTGADGSMGETGGGVGGIGVTKAGDGGNSAPFFGGIGGNSGGGGGSGSDHGGSGAGGGGGGIGGGNAPSFPADLDGGIGGYGGGGGGGGIDGKGGMGGFGGGGGGGWIGEPGGDGGFGGGGGAGGIGEPAGESLGAIGGFGGGGGGGQLTPNGGGIGGGVGNNGLNGGISGGGAGFGGAIFVKSGSLTINGPFSTNGSNSALGGASGGVTASQGWQAGNDFFFLNGSIITFDPNGGAIKGPITITNSIADDRPPSFVGAPAGVTQPPAGSGTAINIGSNQGGTVTFLSQNTYSGTTTINSGTLSLSGSGALYASDRVIINNNVITGTFDISLISAPGTEIGDLTGALGTFVQLGSKTLTLGNTNNSTIFAGSIQDASLGGGITKVGSGTFTLSGTNSYTGATNVNAGVLQAGAMNSFSPNSAVTLANTSGAALDLNNFSQTIPSLSGGGNSGGNVTLGSGTLTTGSGGSTSYSGAISGSGVLEKTGSSTFTLLHASSYTGGTLVNAGILQVGNNTALGGASIPGTTVASGASLQLLSGISVPSSQPLNISGTGVGGIGALTKISNVSATYGGPITVNASATIGTNGAGTLTLSGGITKNAALTLIGGGTIAITTTGISGGSSNLIIDGVTANLNVANTYTGPTLIIDAAVINANIANVLSTSSLISMDLSGSGGSSLILGVSEAIQALAGASSSLVNLSSNTLTIGTTSGTTTFAGSISGTGGITKTGASIQILSGTNNSYGGTTSVNGGTLRAGATNAFSPNSIVSMANTAGAILDLNGFSQNIASLTGGGATGGNVTLGAGTLTINQNNTYAGSISGAGGVTFNIPSFFSFQLSGTNTYGGNTTIVSGGLQAEAVNTFSPNSEVILPNLSGAFLDLNNFSQTIGSLSGGGPSAAGFVNLGTGTLTTGSKNSTTYSGSIAGDPGGNLIKVGTNTTFTLAGTNNYVGSTQVQQGILQAGKVNAFSPSSDVIMSNTAGATLDLNNFSQQILSLSGGGTTGGNVTLGSGTLTTGPTLGNITYSGSISGTGGLTKVGTGTFMLEGSNTYFGTTTVTDGVLVANAANPNELSPNSAVVMNNLSSAHLFVFNSQTIASLGGGGASGGNVQIGMLNGVLTTGGGGSSTYGGSITGAGNAQLIKVGATTFNLTGTNTIAGTTVNAGTLNLTGTNTFTTTTVNGGNLAVNGPLTSTVTVEAGGTLSGNSTITGVVTNNGTISPGNSIDTLTIVGQYIQASGSTYLVEVSPALSDRIVVIGVPGTATIQPNATLHISPMPGTYSVSQTYLILSTLNGVTGTFDNIPNDLPTVHFTVLYTLDDVFLEVISIPIATVTCGGNIGKVAQYIDTLSPPIDSDLTNVIHILRSMTDMDALNQALVQLQPAPYKNLVLAQEENVFTISRGISDHLNTLLNPYCHKKPDEKTDTRTNSRNKANTPKKVDRKRQYELWGSVFGDWASLNNRSSSHCKADETLGYGAKGGGALFGFDYYFTEHWAFGVTSAYSYSYVNVNESRVKGHINSVYGALYGIWQQNHLFFDAAFIAGCDQFNASRKIHFSAPTAGSIHRTAYTNHGGWNVDGHLDGGYVIEPWDTMRICPFVAVDCLFLHENKFHESGADSLDLRVQSSNNLLLRTEGGLYISKCFAFSYGSWTPEVRASAVWEGFNSDAQFYRSNFVGEPGSFVVKNRNPNRVLVSPGGGVSGSFYDDQMTMLLDYFGEYGYGYHNQVIKAEFAWAF